MTHSGGIQYCRDINEGDRFEVAINRALGDAVRQDITVGYAVYAAITNMEWRHADGDSGGYTFRAAGDMLAAIRGSGDYLDFYCSSPEGVVRADIAEAMASEGWQPIEGGPE